MADAVYLHIGAPKTGTSYLQVMLWRHRALLEEQGIFLPLEQRQSHFDAAADVRGGMWAAGRLIATWDDLVADVRARPGIAVVSEELFCGVAGEEIDRIIESLAPTPLHVIYAARDLGRQVPAAWQQALRARQTVSYDDFLADLANPDQQFWEEQDPTVAHARWADRLPGDRFHLLLVPPRTAPASLLWERFCSVFGADPADTSPPATKQNVSLGVVEAELLRRFNAQLGDLFPMRNDYIRVVREHLMLPGLFGAPTAERIGVPAQFHDWITNRAEQMVRDVAVLAEQVDVIGDPADLAAQLEAATLAPGDLSEAELLQAALAAWTRQLQAIELDLDEREEERRQLRRARRRARRQQEQLDAMLSQRVRRRLGAVKRRLLQRP